MKQRRSKRDEDVEVHTGNRRVVAVYELSYRERHTNNATEMSPYVRFSVSFPFFFSSVCCFTAPRYTFFSFSS